ncbi:helix-turn-helix domain-containing protein [Aquiflexum sp.]|uniref:helix-turn-helix domain-containing protein n=1 Tax=Aquiflexum sp. TaxID=1872584 RepID=UPI003592EDAA
MKDSRKFIGENLKKLRIKANFSQRYLGEVLDKNDYTAYQRIENGKAHLKYEDAFKLSEIYNIPMEEILDSGIVKKNNDSAKYEYQLNTSEKNIKIQIGIFLDGTEDLLEEQMKLIRRINEYLSKT